MGVSIIFCVFTPKTVDLVLPSLCEKNPFLMREGGTKPTDARDAKPNARVSQLIAIAHGAHGAREAANII